MKIFANVLFTLAAILLVVAFIVAFQYGDYDSEYSFINDGFWDKMGHVVGGDAYNYIIMASRGVLFGVASLVCALVGSVIYITSYLAQLVEMKTQASVDQQPRSYYPELTK